MKKLKKKKEIVEQIDVAYMITDNTSNAHSASSVNPP